MLCGVREERCNSGLRQTLGSGGSPVEVDETYIGGTPKNLHKSRKKRLNLFGAYGDHKTGVMGMLDRETR